MQQYGSSAFPGTQQNPKSSPGKLLLKIALVMFGGGQLLTFALHKYLADDWASFKNQAVKVEAEVTRIETSTRTRQVYDQTAKRNRTESTTIYIVELKAQIEGRTHKYRVEGSRLPSAPVGGTLLGYVNQENSNEIRIEGLNQNLAGPGFFHLVACMMTGFIYVFIALFVFVSHKLIANPQVVKLLQEAAAKGERQKPAG